MEEKVLKIFARELKALGIRYSYMVNNAAKIEYPYVTGEFSESGYSFEDGSTDGEMLLEAWTRNSELDLVRLKDKIKQHFSDYTEAGEGFAVHIAYTTKVPVRTNDPTLRKIEIRLSVRYWGA